MWLATFENVGSFVKWSGHTEKSRITPGNSANNLQKSMENANNVQHLITYSNFHDGPSLSNRLDFQKLSKSDMVPTLITLSCGDIFHQVHMIFCNLSKREKPNLETISLMSLCGH